jgi:hypothetical protein
MSRNEWAIETVIGLELKALGKPVEKGEREFATLLRNMRRKNTKGEDFTGEEMNAYYRAKEDIIESLNDM